MSESPLQTISRVTGLQRKDMDEIFQQVKANQAKLDGCPRHDFSIPIDHHTKKAISERKMFCDWECKNCHGWVDLSRKQWYEKGLLHASCSS